MRYNFKKYLIVCLVITLIVTMIGCDIDPYDGKRPIDYVGSEWISEGEGYRIYFNVDNTNENILVIGNEVKVNFDFLWSAFDPKVNAFEVNNEKNDIFSGNCKFNKESFEIYLSEKSEICEPLPDVLTFNRIC